MNRSRRQALEALGTAGVVSLAGCLGDDTSSGTEDDPTNTEESTTDDAEVSAVFVYHDDIGDFGWLWAHDQSRRRIDEEFEWLKTAFFESVSPDSAEVQLRQYAERDFDVIFGTTFDYMESMYEIAPEYPDVIFEHCSGYRERENLGLYFGRMYEPRYLTGVSAAMLSESGRLGYVASFPISEVIRGINAFARGAASVDPDVSVEVGYTETWDDETVESDTAMDLIDAGVDVMAQHQDSPAAAETASEAGLWAFGYNSPMGEFVGDGYVTTPIWDWNVYYRRTVRDIRNGTWESDFYWEGLDAGIVGLDEFGPQVPDDVRETVAKRRSRLESGDLDVWADTKFAHYTDAELFEDVDSYVDNVEVRE
ncbi:MAG: BMP family ABC transporter substrate-binding protein [Natronomonas sp.]